MIAIIPPKARTKAGLILPGFKMYKRSGLQMMGRAEAYAEAAEFSPQQEDELLDDLAGGMHETKPIHTFRPYTLGVVVGENMPYCEQFRMARPPQLGDVVHFLQSAAMDWTAFHKMPCETTPGQEFLMTNTQTDKWLKVPRGAELVFVPLNCVLGFETFGENHE